MANALAVHLTEYAASHANLDQAVLAVVDGIHRRPAHPVGEWPGDVGLSERHLRRRFEDQFGVGIKEYARLVRFQRLLDATRRYKRGFGGGLPGWPHWPAITDSPIRLTSSTK